MYSRGHDSCICENIITQKGHFAGQNILILKHSHFAWCNNSDAYCSLAVSFAGRNIPCLLQRRPKKTNRPSRDCHNSNFPFFELWHSSSKYAMCIASRYLHRNKQEACEHIPDTTVRWRYGNWLFSNPWKKFQKCPPPPHLDKFLDTLLKVL